MEREERVALEQKIMKEYYSKPVERSVYNHGIIPGNVGSNIEKYGLITTMPQKLMDRAGEAEEALVAVDEFGNRSYTDRHIKGALTMVDIALQDEKEWDKPPKDDLAATKMFHEKYLNEGIKIFYREYLKPLLVEYVKNGLNINQIIAEDYPPLEKAENKTR